jgi:hypothetical protein
MAIRTGHQKQSKNQRPEKMKKVVLTGIVAVFVLGMTSCGGGHTCDAYRSADYTKYKAEKSNKIELNINRKSN